MKLKVAVFKMVMFLDNPSITGCVYSEGEASQDWVRVTEWEDIDFKPIEIDAEDAKAKQKASKIAKAKADLELLESQS